VIICDTSGLLAAYWSGDARQKPVLDQLKNDPGPLVLSPFVLAELDYMVLREAGVRSELDVLSDVAQGVYHLADFSRSDIAAAAAVIDRYADLRIGLADASIVVLADRFRTTRLLTFDERHFRSIRPLSAEAFTILPADG
jgi:predicted nucleic acid-binding protein